ncbi:MAG: hypothetical protein HUJ58_03535, partial [Erysipelotrichaceae bacterium]|nr:hypothetical protein [Erysipelotrichaceae bacterium]
SAIITAPTANTGLTYDGNDKIGVNAKEGYTLTSNDCVIDEGGNAVANTAGTYTVTATLNKGCIWSDGSFEDKTVSFTIEKTKVDVPKGNTKLTENGKNQIGVKGNAGYTLTSEDCTIDEKGNAVAKEVGTYTVTATIKDGYIWKDGSLEDKTITFTIKKQTEPQQPSDDPEPEHSHKGELVEGVEPTCEEDGTKDYYECECGLYFEDEDCTIEILNIDKWKVVKALGHIDNDEDGKCDRCGKVLEEKNPDGDDKDSNGGKENHNGSDTEKKENKLVLPIVVGGVLAAFVIFFLIFKKKEEEE